MHGEGFEFRFEHKNSCISETYAFAWAKMYPKNKHVLLFPKISVLQASYKS